LQKKSVCIDGAGSSETFSRLTPAGAQIYYNIAHCEPYAVGSFFTAKDHNVGTKYKRSSSKFVYVVAGSLKILPMRHNAQINLFGFKMSAATPRLSAC
jgi:hypothetical protein